MKGVRTVDKDYYEVKLREILDRDEKNEVEMVQMIIEFILLNYQYHMNK